VEDELPPFFSLGPCFLRPFLCPWDRKEMDFLSLFRHPFIVSRPLVPSPIRSDLSSIDLHFPGPPRQKKVYSRQPLVTPALVPSMLRLQSLFFPRSFSLNAMAPFSPFEFGILLMGHGSHLFLLRPFFFKLLRELASSGPIDLTLPLRIDAFPALLCPPSFHRLP